MVGLITPLPSHGMMGWVLTDCLPASSELGVDVGLVEGNERLILQIY